MNKQEVLEKIAAFRAITGREEITPDSLGALLQDILDLLAQGIDMTTLSKILVEKGVIKFLDSFTVNILEDKATITYHDYSLIDGQPREITSDFMLAATDKSAGLMSKQDKLSLLKISNNLTDLITSKGQPKGIAPLDDEGNIFPVFFQPVIKSVASSEFNLIEASDNTYYRVDGTINQLAVKLPEIRNSDKAVCLMINFTTSDNPFVAIMGGEEEISYYAGYEIEPSTTYELNIMFNGSKWIVAYATVE